MAMRIVRKLRADVKFRSKVKELMERSIILTGFELLFVPCTIK